MQPDSDKIKLLCGNGSFESMRDLSALQPFDCDIIEALSELSANIMKDRSAKLYPDVITFAFFCRRANTEKLKKEHSDGKMRLGRGLSFHIAPSNVPVNFAYSLTAALLAGNSCIVRVSEKDFKQTDIICAHIAKLFNDGRFTKAAERIAVVRYPRDEEINAYFSSLADIRVIWGGDKTVTNFRNLPLPPRGKDITFADRYSFAVIDCEAYLEAEDKAVIAADFYNDTYLFDQNACTSPMLIIRLGNKDSFEKASETFYDELHSIAADKYSLQDVAAVDKFTAQCRLAADKGAVILRMPDNLVSITRVGMLSADLPEYKAPCGSFIENFDTTLEFLADIVTEKYQTAAYYGEKAAAALEKLVIDGGLHGIDRIVPIGKASDFSLTWDGYDLIFEMSRVVDFRRV